MSVPLDRTVALVSVSIDLGAGRRGVDMGPSALRIAGLTGMLDEMGYTVREAGTVFAEGPEAIPLGESRARFLAEITGVCERSRDLVLRVLEDDCFPLILGGDHSLSMGTVAALARHQRSAGSRIGLIWVDAHTDMNTPDTTPSGNIHGMSLAVLTGRGPDALTGLSGDSPAVLPENVCVIGARHIDEAERSVVRGQGVRVFTMSEVDERGMADCVDEAIGIACAGTAGYHLSFDLDALDPMVAPRGRHSHRGRPDLPGGAPRVREGGAVGPDALLRGRGAQPRARRGEPNGPAGCWTRGQRARQDDSLKPKRREQA